MACTLNRFLPALLVGALACGQADSTGRTQYSGQAALLTFSSNSDLEQYIEDTAVAQMRDQLEQSCAGGGWLGAPGAGAPESDSSQNGGERAPSYSETNTQVAGVDEADFVKTDGWKTYYLSGGQLHVLRTWPAPQTALLASVPVEGWPQEMFLDGDRLVVFSQVYGGQVPGTDAVATNGWWYGTRVTVYDVSQDSPVETNGWYLNGWYTSSRRIDSSVRIVLSSYLNWPAFNWWPDYAGVDWNNESQRMAACRAQMDANEQAIRAWTLAQWLPQSYQIVGGVPVPMPMNPTRVYRPTDGGQLGLAVVATLQIGQSGLDQTAVVTYGGETYASQDNLYLASVDWSWGSWADASYRETTSIHKFSLTNPARVEYLASGRVEGHIVDQFSMDEWQGDLRIATSTWGWWSGLNGQQALSDNRVRVLGQSGASLETVGETPTLAAGEQIQSSRFAGAKAFVVTYRQVDPLFTLDMSDRQAPRIVGELTIPGFSTYIHILGETKLLTIGQDFNLDGTIRNGVALQLFDVQNLANPVLVSKQLVGTSSGYSEALWDHKAFNYFAETGILAVPHWDWTYDPSGNYWSQFQSALKLYAIDPDAGVITPRGEVSHADLYQAINHSDWSGWYVPYVRRGVQMVGDEGDGAYVYSFSNAGLKVNRLDTQLTPVSTTLFPWSQPYWW